MTTPYRILILIVFPPLLLFFPLFIACDWISFRSSTESPVSVALSKSTPLSSPCLWVVREPRKEGTSKGNWTPFILSRNQHTLFPSLKIFDWLGKVQVDVSTGGLRKSPFFFFCFPFVAKDRTAKRQKSRN